MPSPLHTGSIHRAMIFTPQSPKRFTAIEDGYLVVSPSGLIEAVTSDDCRTRYPSYTFFDYTGCLITPGFVDLHNHLPQYAFAGIGDKDLLAWLKKYAFPREALFRDAGLARSASEIFFQALIANGTTTTVTYSTSHFEATDIAFEAASRAGVRAVIGKSVMTGNAPRPLKESPDAALQHTEALIQKWHGCDDRLFYAVTPRFALNCSMNVMKRLAALADKTGVYIQTHLAENRGEVAAVKKMFPRSQSYTEVYFQAGLLGERTLTAHNIYLSHTELGLLRKTKTALVHCPTSNRFLTSGLMAYRKYAALGMRMGLGTDVAGGYSLSMLNEMKEAIETSKLRLLFFPKDSAPMTLMTPMTVEEAFYLATLGGATALSMQTRIGSLEKGKAADFLISDLSRIDAAGDRSLYREPKQILSKLIYCSTDAAIRHVFVGGIQLK